MRLVDGAPQHEGYVSPEGRHFPGAESGGARAMYDPGEHCGLGLVSADGWRVPYSGSDCVVYHEGLGHALGLLHPEPINDLVMSTAQYVFALNETWLDNHQKQKMRWQPQERPVDLSHDLFAPPTSLKHSLRSSSQKSIGLLKIESAETALLLILASTAS